MPPAQPGPVDAARAAVLDALCATPQAVAVTDGATGRVLAASAAFEALLGPAVRSLDDLALDDDRAHVRGVVEGRDVPGSGPLRFRRPGGDTVACSVSALRLTLPDGRAVAAVVLEPSARGPDLPLAPAVLDRLDMPVEVRAADGRYVYCNAAAVPDAQVRAQLVGRTPREAAAWLGHPQHVTDARDAHFRTSRATGRGTQFVERVPTPLGDRVTRWTYSPVPAGDGTTGAVIACGHDVTAEHAQAQHLAVLETMVGTSLDALMVINATPGRRYLTLDYGNAALHALLARHGMVADPDRPLTAWPFGPRDRAALAQLRAALRPLPGTVPQGGTYTLVLPDVREWLELAASPVLDAHGTATHWTVDLRVVTERHRAHDTQLRLAEANALALDGQPLAVSVAALLGGVSTWYPGWCAAAAYRTGGQLVVLGDAPDALRATLHDTPLEVLRDLWRARDPHRRGRPAVFEDLPATLRGRVGPDVIAGLGVCSTVELPLYDRDGDILGVVFAAHVTREAIPDGLTELLEARGPALALLLERDVQRVRVEQLAYTDPLTGLMNRWTFNASLDRALEQASGDARVALGVMDLDRFKHVNDGLGHASGDALLRLLAARLADVAARHDLTAVARMGGDEFAFLLHEPGRIPAVVEDLRAVFDTPFDLGQGVPLLLQGSVGWSVAPDTACDAEALHQQADAAMYVAKRQQRFSQVFEPSERSGIQALTLETAMRHALARREFRLVYQPQVSSTTGELYGAEALLRWTDPTLGDITPDQFLPVAELTGLMGQLGAWVLDTACVEAAGWTDEHLTVSVNVSSTQLQDPQFAVFVRHALRVSGLDPRRLVLEVTETGLIDNPAPARAMLQSLRDEGVRISIDDFGTGYSTLYSLRALPVDELKIDRAFIHDIGDGSREGWESRAIMRATLQLAHTLDIAVVAEGVERQVQADALREVGCDLHQGWLIARGLEVEDFAQFVREWPAQLGAAQGPERGGSGAAQPSR